MTNGTDLSDFGGGVDDDPPQVRKTTAIHISANGEVRHVGHLARVTTPGYPTWAYITTRNPDIHQYRVLGDDDGGAYAVSTSVIDEVQREAHRKGSTGPQTVFVVETGGDVLEWRAEKLFEGPLVPDEFLDTKSDPQRYVTPSNADAIWRDHAPDGFYDHGASREAADR